MHGDFKYNFIRFHILNEASKKAVELDDFKNFFDKRDVSDVTDDEVKDQLKHLRGENFLIKKDDSHYEITDQGLEEIGQVKNAMSHF